MSCRINLEFVISIISTYISKCQKNRGSIRTAKASTSKATQINAQINHYQIYHISCKSHEKTVSFLMHVKLHKILPSEGRTIRAAYCITPVWEGTTVCQVNSLGNIQEQKPNLVQCTSCSNHQINWHRNLSYRIWFEPIKFYWLK